MNFTWDSYQELIECLEENQREYYMRHDVDFSLKKAVEMAQMDSEMRIQSTFYVLLNAEFYNPYSKESLESIEQILDYGCEIGVHIDHKCFDVNPGKSIVEICRLVDAFQTRINKEIKYITFHKPFLQGEPKWQLVNLLQERNLFYPNMNKTWKYISDSGMKWREDPVGAILLNQKLQINTHPIWWDKSEGTMEDRIHSLGLDLDVDEKIINEIKSIRNYIETRN